MTRNKAENHFVIEKAEAKDCYPLRHEVLRPHQPISMSQYPLDHKEDSFHVKLLVNGEVVAVGSVYHEDETEAQGKGVWRIRGMAVRKNFQGQGFGARVLTALIDYVKSKNARRIWCNARTTATGFYLSEGFHQVGDEYDLPDLGPHLHLRLEIKTKM